jgi:hypothetical protein
MYTMRIDAIEEIYTNIDEAMHDCLEIFPEAFFSDWNEDNMNSWLDIFVSYSERTVIGRIYEI